MIIFGIRSGRLKSLKAQMYDCGYCKTEKALHFCFFQKYIHIFWIPVIPIGKTGSSVCTHCHQALRPEQMPEWQQQKFREEKSTMHTPIGYKIVLLLIAALLILIMLLGIYQTF